MNSIFIEFKWLHWNPRTDKHEVKHNIKQDLATNYQIVLFLSCIINFKYIWKTKVTGLGEVAMCRSRRGACRSSYTTGESAGAAMVNQPTSPCRESTRHIFAGAAPPTVISRSEDSTLLVFHVARVNQPTSPCRVSTRHICAAVTCVLALMPMTPIPGIRDGKRHRPQYQHAYGPTSHVSVRCRRWPLAVVFDPSHLGTACIDGHCLLAAIKMVMRWRQITLKGIHDSPNVGSCHILTGAMRLHLKSLLEYGNVPSPFCNSNLSEGPINPQKSRIEYPFPHVILNFRELIFSLMIMFECSHKFWEQVSMRKEIEGGMVLPNAADVCASFQYSVARHLLRQTQRAMLYIDVRELLPKENQVLVVSGGVACNQSIKNAMQTLCDAMEYRMVCPPPRLCTDNGIMIAWNGMERWKANAGILYNNEDIRAVDIEPKPPKGNYRREETAHRAQRADK
ncbi:unnamed protein product, partial [Meganyctiphanes norvegica]